MFKIFGESEHSAFGRNSVSGTYGYFKSKALCKGDFKNSVNEQPGSASVVQSVTASANGIGYSGIGYRTAGVRALPLSKKLGGKLITANTAEAIKVLIRWRDFCTSTSTRNPVKHYSQR